ncbi:MAG: hypothetical protein MZW92_31365 [Comamonadaceae bacterium]|nr:hypothetical protein [Comamonadaceae bacterium]
MKTIILQDDICPKITVGDLTHCTLRIYEEEPQQEEVAEEEPPPVPPTPTPPAKPLIEFKNPLPRVMEELRELFTAMLQGREDPNIVNVLVKATCDAEKLERPDMRIDALFEHWAHVLRQQAPLEDGLNAFVSTQLAKLTGARTTVGQDVVKEILSSAQFGAVRAKLRKEIDHWLELGLESTMVGAWDDACTKGAPHKYLSTVMDGECRTIENQAAREATRIPDAEIEAIVMKYMPPPTYPHYKERLARTLYECKKAGYADPINIIRFGWGPYRSAFHLGTFWFGDDPERINLVTEHEKDVEYFGTPDFISAKGELLRSYDKPSKYHPRNDWMDHQLYLEEIGRSFDIPFQMIQESLRRTQNLPAIGDRMIEGFHGVLRSPKCLVHDPW